MTDVPWDFIVSTSPQRPDDVVHTHPIATPEDVRAAVVDARGSGSAWRESSPGDRSALLTAFADGLNQRRDEVCALIVREVGKPSSEARAEVERAVALARYFSQQPFGAVGRVFESPGAVLAFTRRRPLGVAGLITPWNFPLAIPLWKAMPAMATGNAVLLKPSSEAIGVAAWLGQLARETLPRGLFQVLAGGSGTAETLIDNADVVSFTGSTTVGLSVVTRASSLAIPVQAEMGGHNPAVVLPDADPVTTADLLTSAVTGYAGQKCTATRRIIVVGDCEPLLDHLRQRFTSLSAGDPATAAGAVGPLISSAAAERFEQAVVDARAAGAEVVQSNDPLPPEGWYVRPTLVTGLPEGHRLLSEEIFGPIVAVQCVGSLKLAVELANDVPYGLVASVHGRDLSALESIASGLEAGMVKVNATTTGADYWMPFGGDKHSSAGAREQGEAALDFFTSTQTVTVLAS